MSDLRVPKNPVDVEILFDGLDLFQPGQFFLGQASVYHRDAETLHDFLNRDTLFVPFNVERGVMLINLDTVVAVRSREPVPFSDICPLELQTTVDGILFKLNHFEPMPSGQQRVVDYLNSGPRFLRFREHDHIIYIHTAHVARVMDR